MIENGIADDGLAEATDTEATDTEATDAEATDAEAIRAEPNSGAEPEVGPAGPQRLDVALTERGLAPSRTRAAQLIAGGLVAVDGEPALKPSLKVTADQMLEVESSDHYVSRAAHKLNAALDSFQIAVTDRNPLDVGASTGGFSQVLLERGAAHVIALDVGHDQLVAQIRSDQRISVLEGVNARYLSAAKLAELLGRPVDVDLVVIDVSFISLRQVLPPVADSVRADADFVLLIKPQFEVGRTGVKEGIVTNAELRADAVAGVLWAAWDLGLGTSGLISSPIAGSAGNKEYLAHVRRGGQNPTEWLKTVSQLCA